MIYLENIEWEMLKGPDREQLECDVDYGSEAILKDVIKGWLQRKYNSPVKEFTWHF